MTGTANAAGLVAATAFTLPALGFATAPVFERTADTWQQVGPLSRFTDMDYVPEVITIEPGVGEAGLSIAYIRKHNLTIDGPIRDQYDRDRDLVASRSRRLSHPGICRPQFRVPCHCGVYDFRGISAGGAATATARGIASIMSCGGSRRATPASRSMG